MNYPVAEVLRARSFQAQCIGTLARNADVVEHVPSALSSSSRSAERDVALRSRAVATTRLPATSQI
jgi:hypothetical protein